MSAKHRTCKACLELGLHAEMVPVPGTRGYCFTHKECVGKPIPEERIASFRKPNVRRASER